MTKGGKFQTRKFFNYPELFLYCLYSSKLNNTRVIANHVIIAHVIVAHVLAAHLTILSDYLTNAHLTQTVGRSFAHLNYAH